MVRKGKAWCCGCNACCIDESREDDWPRALYLPEASSGRTTGYVSWADTHIIIENPIFRPVSFQILERVIGWKIFELNKQVREDGRHGRHELVHEFLHLNKRSSVINEYTSVELNVTSASPGRRCLRPRYNGSSRYLWVFVPTSRQIGNVDVGRIPAPEMYRSLKPCDTVYFPKHKYRLGITAHNFPMAIGRPFAPRSPRPRILEPEHESQWILAEKYMFIPPPHHLWRRRCARPYPQAIDGELVRSDLCL